jgi:hypothetical protein
VEGPLRRPRRKELDRPRHLPPGTRTQAPRRQRDPHHPHPARTRQDSVHIRQYGTTPDGRVFQTSRGGIIQDSAYSAVWAEARKKALTEAQCRSPLGRRPYDLRHAAVSGRGAWSGLRSATAAVPGCRGCARPEVTGRAGAGIGGGAGCSVGVAAAWRADGDLVRASPRLRVSPRQETARAALQKPELTRDTRELRTYCYAGRPGAGDGEGAAQLQPGSLSSSCVHNRMIRMHRQAPSPGKCRARNRRYGAR